MQVRLGVITTLTLLALGITSRMTAATIYSTFGPGGTFNNIQNGDLIGGGTQFSNAGREYADPFTVSQVEQVGAYEIAAALSGLPSAGDVGYVSLWSGASAPTVPIETNVQFGPMAFNNPGGGITPPILTAFSGTHPVLQPGVTYWVVASGVDPLADLYAWRWSTLSGLSRESRLTGGSWANGGAVGDAFAVLSTAPEPGAMSLFAAGLAALALIRRRS